MAERKGEKRDRVLARRPLQQQGFSGGRHLKVSQRIRERERKTRQEGKKKKKKDGGRLTYGYDTVSPIETESYKR